MFKKLKPGESEEDILRMSSEFDAERAKNPGFQPAAAFVRADRAPKKSMFAHRREQAKLGRVTSVPEKKQEEIAPPAKEIKEMATSVPHGVGGTSATTILMDEIQENILGDVKGSKMSASSIKNVLGEIVERREGLQRPAALQEPKLAAPRTSRSIFGRQMLKENSQIPEVSNLKPDSSEIDRSALTKDSKMAQEIHEENLSVINRMSEQEILAEREKLLNSLDPSLVALLSKKRQTKEKAVDNIKAPKIIEAPAQPPKATTPITSLPESSPALELLQRSDEGNWINFNLVEDHKLAWMRDIPAKLGELKPGQQFDARFDWKGVLLPHTLKDGDSSKQLDERELYLHGEEADRPGYTLQELFRLARYN